MFPKTTNATATRKFLTTVTLCAVCVALTGCGKKRNLDKVIVEGNVSYDGQPVVNGDIKFYPVEGTQGPVSGAPIKDGHYIITNKDGVPIGTHTIQIRGFDVSGGAGGGDLISGGEGKARIQIIPDKYNRETELTAVVSSDTEEIDFQLEK